MDCQQDSILMGFAIVGDEDGPSLVCGNCSWFISAGDHTVSYIVHEALAHYQRVHVN